MKKQILTGFIAAAMALTFASCGPVDDDGASTDKQQPSAEKTSAAETTAASTEASTEPASDDDSIPTVFEQFLNGEIEAQLTPQTVNELSFVCTDTEYMADQLHVIYTFEGAASLSLAELTELVKTSPDVDASGAQAMYALFDTVSGNKALAVRYQGVGIDGPNSPESAAFFIFVTDGDSLRLSYSVDSWSRSYKTLFSNGVFQSAGSAGAGDSISSCSMIDENGEFMQVYKLETLFDSWIAMSDYETFGSDTDWCTGASVQLLETFDGKYYSYAADNKTVDFEKFDIYLTNLNTNGWEMVEDANTVALEKRAAAGINELIELTDWISIVSVK